MIETLTWKGFTFTVKPFTLGTLYDLWEGIGDAAEGGKMITGTFQSNCKVLLVGSDKAANGFLLSGELAKSILDSEDVEQAMAFKNRIDFFTNSFTTRGQRLMESAPDLKDQLVQKAAKASRPKSQKDTKAEPAHSG